MDFASLMKSEISKGSKTSKTSSTLTTTQTKSSKYLKRSELEAQREDAYREEQDQAERSREERATKKRKAEEDEAERVAMREAKKRRLAEDSRKRREEDAASEEAARRKRVGLPPLPEKKEEGTLLPAGQEDVPEEELMEKLREMKEPVTLFGENHATRLKRYFWLIAPKQVLTNTPIPTTLELLPESEQLVPKKPPPATLALERQYLYRQLASYFTLVLTEWTRALAGRTKEVQESYQGKQAAGACVQSRDNMRPLFRKFEKGEINDAVLDGVVEIVRAAQERRYVDGSDAYLRLSIGKAAWPIGVTMVGIHERSAREKLHETDQVAHIMSDEVTRKYLQSIKQCLSYAQTRWPPDDHLQLMG